MSRERKNRHIIKHIIVRGLLVLDTPTCLSSGEEGTTDMVLLRDSVSNAALLTGSSIAGALRNYLRERAKGYNKHDDRNDPSTILFGDLLAYKNDDTLSEQEKIKLREKDSQSLLIIDDAISNTFVKSELRDGVKIDSITRIAEDKKKYDFELLQAGTQFSLCFELLVDSVSLHEKQINVAELIKAFTIALQGLEPRNGSESGAISIGMKKRRGFGRCHVEKWQVWQFNLANADERLAWLTYDHWTPGLIADYPSQDSIATALGVQLDDQEDQRDRLTISATFNLASPILIRSGQADTKPAPDVVHLKSNRPRKNGSNGEESKPDEKNLVPILSGTSLAGVLRHRAERIVKTLQCASGQNPGSEKEPEIVKSIFGDVSKTRSQASRLTVDESVIENVTGQNELVQTRIAIDRFTGGAYPGALFQEQPVFNSDNTDLKLDLELRQPKEHEIGLLLLLLKDLWTEDLSVGGSSSIGRGRLKGKEATITWQCSEKMQWEIKQDKEKLQVSGSIGSEDSVERKLETFVKALNTYVKQEEKP
jgi:CRISPR/Cas system CSM-associated protein Csm3 (group 7 of RAMP superfamily)